MNETKRVEPEGPVPAKIMIVGEAPGADEERRGRPFVGRSGELLDKLLAGAQISRSECYVTNVFKVRPPKNDVGKFINLEARQIEESQFFINSRTELYTEIELVKPNIIVALGRTALYALTGQTKIGSYRGSVLPLELADGKVLATYHPAAALRVNEYVYIMARDLKKIKHEAESPLLRPTERTLMIGETLDVVMQSLEKFQQLRTPIAFDIETMKGVIVCLAFASSPSYAISIPLNDDRWTCEAECEIWRSIARILQNPDITKVGQNVNFDATYILAQYGIFTTPLEDTMIQHGILYPDLPKGLDFLCSAYTNTPYYKDDGKEVFKGFSKNMDQLYIYNAKDAAVTLEVFQRLEMLLKQQGNYETYLRQKAILPVLLKMQKRGILVDTEGLRSYSTSLIPEIQAKEAELAAYIGDRNWKSPKQLCNYFYEQLGHAPYANRAGRATVDDIALRRLERKGAKAAGLILELRRLNKLKSTYLEMSIDTDGRFRCFFNPVGATTGRLSSRKSIPHNTGGNSQNLDPRAKKYYRADPSHLLVELDYSQAECRIVAYSGPVQTLKRIYDQGLDVYTATYAMMFNIPYEKVSRDPGSSPLGDGTKSQRQWGKTSVLSLNYGLGINTFALRNGLTQKQAKNLYERYHRVHPGVTTNYQSRIQEQLRKGRTVTNPYGRIRTFMGHWGIDLFHQAYAFFPQSTVGDKINKDGLTFVSSLEDQGVFLLNQIHDSILFEISLEYGLEHVQKMLLVIKNSMEQPIPWTPPFIVPVEGKMGKRWGDPKQGGGMYDLKDFSLERITEIAGME